MSDRIELYIALTDRLDWAAARALPRVTPEDIREADSYRQDEGKVLHLVSAYLKRKYVGHWTVSPTGKPVADGVFFNLSHTAGAVVLAIAPAEVGVDVEKVRPAFDDLRAYVSGDEETPFMVSDKDFFAIWTSKESLVKAEGSGFEGKPNTVPALPLNGTKQYKGKVYRAKLIDLGGWMISVTWLGDAPLQVHLNAETLQ